MEKKFRVLIVYPNIPGMLVISLGVGLFTSYLKKAGFEVDLFDSTLFLMDKSISPLNRVEYTQARKFSYDKDLGVRFKSGMIEDFVSKVESFKPDMLAVSVVEDAFHQCLMLLDSVKDKNIPHVIGGVFVTASPEKVISYPQINTICLGEAAQILPKIAERLRDGKSIDDIPNLWIKKNDGSIIKNPLATLIDINKEVFPDYSLFGKERFYRPMGGKIFKTIPLETYRGCPYTCTYCNSPMWNKFYSEKSGQTFYRRKNIDRIIEEIDYLVKEFSPEFFYIIDDTFLARPDGEIKEFARGYKKYSIPFWMNTRPETITEEKLELLKEINCYRMSVGLECGNEEFRIKTLKRLYTNDEVIKKMDILRKSGIPFSVNNIIGFPDETREIVFDTIELNRKISGYDTLTVSILTPYEGTEVREESIQKGYLDPKTFTGHTTESSLLQMPKLSSEEINGLMRTFCMYVKFPKKWWPYIKEAEKFTAQGNEMFDRLKEIYHNIYLSKDQFAKVSEEDINWAELEKPLLETESVL